jgi:hypothetical protein
MTYRPSMSDPSLYSGLQSILFVPTINLDREMFDSELSDNDIKKIFLSTSQLNDFITRVREKNKIVLPITMSDAKKRGIIYNNIKFLLNLFFKKGANLYIYQTKYMINNYKWDGQYKLTNVTMYTPPSVDINIHIVLHKGDELSFINSTRLNCKQKRDNIVSDYYDLVGLEKPADKTAKLSERPVDMTKRMTPYIQSRFSDPRYSDPRYRDPRYSNPRYGDPRYSNPYYNQNIYRDGYPYSRYKYPYGNYSPDYGPTPSYGQRPSYGPTPSYGQRPSYGPTPSYGPSYQPKPILKKKSVRFAGGSNKRKHVRKTQKHKGK